MLLKLSAKDGTGTGQAFMTLTMECAEGWRDSMSPLLRSHCTRSRAAVLGNAAERKVSETLKAGETSPWDDAGSGVGEAGWTCVVCTHGRRRSC